MDYLVGVIFRGFNLVEKVGEHGQHLERRPVDLIVSDHKMPGMSGLEFLRRAADCRPRAVRMLLTGWTEAVPQGELDALEIRALIPKPWDAAELRQLLRSAVEETHVPR